MTVLSWHYRDGVLVVSESGLAAQYTGEVAARLVDFISGLQVAHEQQIFLVALYSAGVAGHERSVTFGPWERSAHG